MGLASIFQSAVCKTVPAGVSILSAKGSGKECVIANQLTLKEPMCRVSPASTSTMGIRFASLLRASLRRKTSAVNDVV